MLIKSAFINRIAADVMAKSLDDLARIIVLEGIAGVPYGTWSRGPTPNFRKAAEALGLPLNSGWVKSDGSFPLYRAMFNAAKKMTRDPDATMDLVSAVIGGITYPRTKGGALYDVGQKITAAGVFEDEKAKGIMDPALVNAIRMLTAHTAQKASNWKRDDVARHKRENIPGTTRVQDGMEREDGMVDQVESTSTQSTIDDTYITMLDGPSAPAVQRWMTSIAEKNLAPAKAKLFKFWIENIVDAGNDLQVAKLYHERVLGQVDSTRQDWKTTGTRFTNLRKELIPALAAEVQNNPPRFLNDADISQALGYSPSVRLASKQAGLIRFLNWLAKI